MNSVPTPNLESQDRTALATNSGPLSDRMCLGTPYLSISSASGEYAWKPIGDGEVGYSTLFRRLVEEDSDAVLAVATHFLPPGGGTSAEAMAINHERVTSLLERVRREVVAARREESHP